MIAEVRTTSDRDAASVRKQVEDIYRTDSRRVLATLIRLLGDFDLAEEALHEAFRAAVEQWPQAGMPANPVAWLVSAGRFKAIDVIRRQARFSAWDEEQLEQWPILRRAGYAYPFSSYCQKVLPRNRPS